jgi:D-alanyl-D-alanine carboxypeptidase (penicillin-binding protein 5/6)
VTGRRGRGPARWSPEGDLGLDGLRALGRAGARARGEPVDPGPVAGADPVAIPRSSEDRLRPGPPRAFRAPRAGGLARGDRAGGPPRLGPPRVPAGPHRRAGRHGRPSARTGLRRGAAAAVAAVVLVGLVAGVQLLRAVPAARVVPRAGLDVATAGTAPALPWPSVGEAAAAVQGVGAIGSSGPSTPLPIASLAKVMTALVVLEDHPLTGSEPGPAVTVTAADAATYRREAAASDSVAAVYPGEVLTERQLLEALLVPSADNVARLLAVWDAGTEAAFVARMNALARRFGMRHTHYADASGLSAATVSTPEDQLVLERAALANPVIKAIVAMPQVSLPGDGVLYNYNYLVGHDGIFGTKTGSSLPAGGCVMMAASGPDGHAVEVVVLGEQGPAPLIAALDAGRRLVDAIRRAVRPLHVLDRGAVVATVAVPWSAAVPAVAGDGVRVLGWSGLRTTVRLEPRRIDLPLPAGAVVGTAVVTVGDQRAVVPVRLGHPLAPPTLPWRLLHG